MLSPWRKAAVNIVTAMPRADAYTGIPEGYTFNISPKSGYATLDPHGSGGWASRLLWWSDGEVQKIDTLPDHQHKGLATFLFNETKKHVPHLHHSEDLTPAGRGWAKSMYDWDPEPEDDTASWMDEEGDDGYSGPSDEEIARHEEFVRQQDAAQEAHWLDFINRQRRAQGKDELATIPDEWRADLGLRTAMTRRKPVYFALNPENPGHAMAYWGDRYDPIAEVKWQTKGLPGYSKGWEPTPEEQGHVDWVWSHPHARRKGITRRLLEWVRDNHEPNLHGSNNMTPAGRALSEALGQTVDDSKWNRLQPVRGYERPNNDAPYRMVDEGRDEWESQGKPGGYV